MLQFQPCNMVQCAEPMAVKHTCALEPHGGFWIAYADLTTEYTRYLNDQRVRLVQARAINRSGMWTKVRAFSVSEQEAWERWALT